MLRHTLAVLLATSALALPVLSQDAGAPAEPAEPVTGADIPGELAMGQPDGAEDGIGSSYVAGTFGDWEQRCVRTADGADPCQLYQLLKDKDDNAVAEISIFGLPEGSEAAAGATAIVPLETLLTEQLLLGVDAAQPKRYPFSWCSQIGCIARLGFTADEVASFKKGNVATMSIVPVVAPDQKVTVTISLKGFTAGLDAVNAANAKLEIPAAAPAEGGN
jgi:invasion protein IalB